MNDNTKNPSELNRRKFISSGTLGVAAAAAMATNPVSSAASTLTLGAGTASAFDIASITIPADLEASKKTAPEPGSFEAGGMNGAQIFARLCKRENLAGLFCCAGNYTIINALAAEGVPSYGGRTEGAMCCAADGFSRATGEVVATSGTEGPGFTNMIVGIAAAHSARTPLLVLASNMQIAGEDREAMIQTVYQQPTTEGMKKYGKRIITPNRIHEYGAHAFRHLKSGVPGPVHLDFPAEVSREFYKDAADLVDFHDSDTYRTESRAYPNPADVKRAVNMITRAKRPLLIAGQGVFQRQGWEPLAELMSAHEMGYVASGPTQGHVPDDHRLSMGTANQALASVDLVIFVGQYCMPSQMDWALPPGVATIRVHPEQDDIGRNWAMDLGIVSDEAYFLEALASALPRKKRPEWVNEISSAKKAFQELNETHVRLGREHSARTGTLHPTVLCHELADFLYHGEIDPRQTVLSAGGFTIGRFASRWVEANRPGQVVIPLYQYGAIGTEIAMTLGAGIAVQRGVGPQAAYKGAPVVCVTGDGGVPYSFFELDTANKYGVPMIVIIYNNDCWGTYGVTERTPQATHMYLFQKGLRYDRMAEGLGVRGEYITTPEEFTMALTRAYDHAAREGKSTVLNCQGIKEFGNGRAYPPGPAWPVEPGRGAITH
ncbi:MAG: thiamine pyrophosphate-binding protein [Pseudomonadales bacterium]